MDQVSVYARFLRISSLTIVDADPVLTIDCCITCVVCTLPYVDQKLVWHYVIFFLVGCTSMVASRVIS